MAALPSESRYMSAEVCLNGHPTTSGIEYSRELTAKFCDTCGAETIRTCPSCNATIRGDYFVPGVLSITQYTPPNHCFNCGTPFPWKTAKLQAAKEQVADLEELSTGRRSSCRARSKIFASGGGANGTRRQSVHTAHEKGRPESRRRSL